MRRVAVNENNLIIAIHNTKLNIPGTTPIESDLSDADLLGRYKYLEDGMIVLDDTMEQRQLNDEKRDALVVINRAYESLCNGIDPETRKDIYVDCQTSTGPVRMNAGKGAADKMDGGVRIFERQGVSHMPVVRDFYNVNHVNVPMSDAINISLQQAADAMLHWQRKGELVDLVNAASTVDEVMAIDLTFPVNVDV